MRNLRDLQTAEYPHLEKFDTTAPGGRADVVGWENVEAMLASGKSGIFFSGHFANWEVPTMALTQRGLAIAEFKDRAAEPRVYDGETAEQRIARRKATWTPTEIVWKGSDPSRMR